MGKKPSRVRPILMHHLWRSPGTKLQCRRFSLIKSSVLESELQTAQTGVVVDVREQKMYDKLHVKGAINYDSKQFLAEKDLDRICKVTFHCQLSLIRGPSCATHLENLLRWDPSGRGKLVEIRVLEGGFKGWERQQLPTQESGLADRGQIPSAIERHSNLELSEASVKDRRTNMSSAGSAITKIKASRESASVWSDWI
ncbi:hypothetical protein HDU91_001814 [Kappamyces sp. JEL0680]|nr:hypothetical protein HDU91_001814 [Kappamyces sp. JEL0680]